MREERAERLRKMAHRSSPIRHENSLSTTGSPESQKSAKRLARESRKLQEMRLAHESSSQELRRQEEAAISAVLRSQALGDALLDHAKLVGNTAELQAKRELEEAHRILLEATRHKQIDEDPIAHLRGKDKIGKGWGFDTARARRQEMLELPPVTSTELEKGWR